MDASRAATGMLEVLAMSTVRSVMGRPDLGSIRLGELLQHLGHLVAALAAAHVDDDVRVAPFGKLMLGHGLAGAETAGNGGGAALGNGEQGVDDPLARDERGDRRTGGF